MSPVSLELRPRARRRWWGAVLLVFGAQLGLIFWLGSRAPIRPRPPAVAPKLQLAGPAAGELLALTDPTLFVLPHRQGFSGLAWLEAKPQKYEPFTWPDQPAWLPLSEAQLGAAFNRFVHSNDLQAVQPPVQAAPALALPPLTETGGFPGCSTVRVTGSLARRLLLTPLEPPSWPYPDLLANSVVQLMVNAGGKPVSVTLLASSGYKEADDYALAQARTVRFQPVGRRGPQRPRNPLAWLTWGELVFEWHTVPPANVAAGQ